MEVTLHCQSLPSTKGRPLKVEKRPSRLALLLVLSNVSSPLLLVALNLACMSATSWKGLGFAYLCNSNTLRSLCCYELKHSKHLSDFPFSAEHLIKNHHPPFELYLSMCVYVCARAMSVCVYTCVHIHVNTSRYVPYV